MLRVRDEVLNDIHGGEDAALRNGGDGGRGGLVIAFDRLKGTCRV